MNIPDQFIKLGIQKIVVTSLTRRETMLYREKTGLDIKLQTKLIITIRGFQHLLDSGHITGIGRGGRYDNNPLTYGDFHNLKTVFKKPDFLFVDRRSFQDIRIHIEKQIGPKTHCLIVGHSKNGEFRLITFYNKNTP